MLYDKFQQEAIDYIKQGYSVIVSAPTGAGKTAIAEFVIEDCIQRGLGVIYTAPIKALSNQKFRDFQGLHQDNIGILTGDVSINPGASVLIMTTEILRNKILDEPKSLNRYSWVIFDEIHYIDNYERGTVWEESLIFLPEHINIVGLSATIPNIASLAAWIESIHKKPAKVVIEAKRPVPLHFFFQCSNLVTDKLEEAKRIRFQKANRIQSLIQYIQQKNGLPCIYFVFGRKRAEDLAFELYSYNFLNEKERQEIVSLYTSLLERFELTHERSAKSLLPLITRGIGYHHAGLLPTLKEVIERLFTSKLLKVIFTTETFALGINMPSRSVIFDDLKKFYGRFIRNLKTRDFYQMAGRAGRRGMDTEGFVYCRINPHRVRPQEAREIIYGRPEEVKSQFNTSYATLLNLYQKYGDEVFSVYPRSLHYFQAKKQQKQEALRLMHEKIKLLKESGYIVGNGLTPQGEFAKSVYGYELILSQLYKQGIFEHLDEFGLGILAAAVVFEPRKNQHPTKSPKNARNIQRICEEAFQEITQKERAHKIYPLSKQPYFHLAKAMECWLQGMKFQHILQFTDTDEGEVVRYFRMAIQILREIREAPISYILKDKITETLRVINRDVVDAEKQLRES